MVLSRNREIALKCMLTLIVLFVAYIRQPELLMEPRFWAEEGTNYFSYGYSHSWLNNLLSPQFGYNTLYNSIATSLAAAVPLEYAPSVTTYLAFFVQVSVSAAVIWWDIPILNSLIKKFILAIFIQILAYARIWVTTIGVQYWLCILTFLILLYNQNAANRKIRVLQNCLLVLNGLTGILSCIMIPAYVLKSIKTKSKQVVTHTSILIVCLLVQVAVFCQAFMTHDAGLESRFGNCNLTYMFSKVIKFEFAVPFIGIDFYGIPSVMGLETAFHGMLSKFSDSPILYSNFGLLELVLGLLILCYLVVLACKKFNQLDTQLIVISIILVTIVSTFFSINRSGGPRYTFAPSIMIMVLVVSAIKDINVPKTVRYLATFLVMLSLTVSCMNYRNSMMGFAYDPAWPKWKDELKVWKLNHDYLIKIHPLPWQMPLSKK